MKHITLLSLSLSLIAACTEHSGESVTPQEHRSQAAAVPADSPPSVAAAPTPSKVEPMPEEPEPVVAPPDRMFVVAEGRCRHLEVSLVDRRPFLHYQPQAIVELGADGAPTGEILDTTLVKDSDGSWEERLPEIERLGGHFPNHVYAEVMEYPREGIRSVYRLTANGWRRAQPFGDAGLERMWPWYDDSLLAFARWVGDKGPRFGVVLGKPKGPRFGAAQRASRCKNINPMQVLVTENGDVVVAFGCDERPNLFVTHWRAGDLEGKTQDLEIVAKQGYIDKIESRKLSTDGSGGFYLAMEAESGSEHLWHGKDASWEPVELPAKTNLTDIALDPNGRLWIAGTTIARREGSKWVTISKPKSASELVGVEHGTPWIRSGDQLWRIADDVAHEVSVPPSAFFEGKSLEVVKMHAAGPDDVWAVASFGVRRREGKAARRYRAVLHSRPNAHPLRCGELTDGNEIKRPYQPWPTAAGQGCQQRMLLLIRRDRWDDSNGYDKIRRAVKKVAGIETVRLAEMEVGGEKYLVALAPEQAVLDAIKAATKRMLKYKYPEVVCGDQAVLDAAGVVVHREVELVGPSPG